MPSLAKKGRRRFLVGGLATTALVLALAAPASALAVTGPTPVYATVADAVFSPLKWLTELILTTMVSLLRWLLVNMMNSIEPNVNQGWFRGQFGIMMRIGALLTVPVAMAATISALLHGGLRNVLNTWLVGVPIALLGGAVAITIVSLAQSIDTNLTNTVLDMGESTFETFVEEMSTLSAIAVLSPGGIALAGIVGLLMIFGMAFLWAELFLRQVMIYMSVLFLPLGFALGVWPATRRWVYNLIEITLVMVFAKFVMTATLVFGLSAMLAAFGGGGDGNPEGFARAAVMISGLIVLFLSVFAMPALIAFVFAPNTEVAGRQQVSGAGPWNPGRKAGRDSAKAFGKKAIGKG